MTDPPVDYFLGPDPIDPLSADDVAANLADMLYSETDGMDILHIAAEMTGDVVPHGNMVTLHHHRSGETYTITVERASR